METDWIIDQDAPVLVTGAAGFIGSKVVENLLERGFRDVRCLVRSTGGAAKLETLQKRSAGGGNLRLIQGNLLSREDCEAATKDVRVVYHLAAGRGEKLVADAFINSVVTTRNLLEACGHHGSTRRFVSISSFSVYTNREKSEGRLLDESCQIEGASECRGDAYRFAKLKQDAIVVDYCQRLSIPFVIVRPGVVYGAGNEGITGRVGLGSFGIFLHLGGRNQIPFTHVDNCAEAIVLAGLQPNVDGEVFNVVDDNLPTSRRFLTLYKRHARQFRSLYLPHALSYLLCWFWETYSAWSSGQLPPVYNRRVWHAYWKKTRYTNKKLKQRLGWTPKISTDEGLTRFFQHCSAQRHTKEAQTSGDSVPSDSDAITRVYDPSVRVQSPPAK